MGENHNKAPRPAWRRKPRKLKFKQVYIAIVYLFNPSAPERSKSAYMQGISRFLAVILLILALLTAMRKDQKSLLNTDIQF